MTINPRTEFLRSTESQKLNQAIAEGWLARACEAVLIDLTMNLPTNSDPQDATAMYNQLYGAKEFCEKLLAFTETPPVPAASAPSHLPTRRE